MIHLLVVTLIWSRVLAGGNTRSVRHQGLPAKPGLASSDVRRNCGTRKAALLLSERPAGEYRLGTTCGLEVACVVKDYGGLPVDSRESPATEPNGILVF